MPESLSSAKLLKRRFKRIASRATVVVLAAISCCPLFAAVPTAEREALTGIYMSSGGNTWANNTNWCNGTCPVSGPPAFNAPGTECTWYGISCDVTKSHVIAVALADNNLAGNLPTVAALSRLQYFNVASNRLSGSIPALAGLGELREFHVDDNQFTGSIPLFTGLTALGDFSVSHNQLTGSLSSLSGLANLYSFTASNNDLTGPVPDISGLSDLQSFEVDDNSLTGGIPSLDSLTSLLKLSLSRNQLTGTIPDLSGSPDLYHVNFGGNQIGGALPAAPASLYTPMALSPSVLCPNALSIEPSPIDPGWNAATGFTPWYATPYVNNACDDIFTDNFEAQPWTMTRLSWQTRSGSNATWAHGPILIDASVGGMPISAPASYFLGLGVYRPSTDHVYLYSDLNTKTFDMNGVFGSSGDIPVVGDFDGNGVTDLAMYRVGLWLIDTQHDFTVDSSTAFGGDPKDVPLAADFDGDGLSDLVIYRSGTWYIRSSMTSQVSQRTFGGLPGDRPVIGDFDRDAIPDIGIYRKGTWLLQASSYGALLVDHFGGLPDDLPCVADWNHDGRADLCIFRDGIWRFKAAGSIGLLGTYTLGGVGDIPLAGGAFDYSESIYVSAAASAPYEGTATQPFVSVSQAFAAATTPSGAVIRVAGGTYTDNFILTGPAYPNGKNSLRILGVDRRAVTWTPPSGDVVTLYGSTNNILEGFTISAPGTGGRGVILLGGGLASPTDPGSSMSIQFNTIIDTGSYGILISGKSNATINYNTIAESQTKSGIGTQNGTPQATITHNDIWGHGYVLASGMDGNGIEAQSSSNLTVIDNAIHDNNRFGVIGIVDSHLVIHQNSITDNQLNGIILCGAASGDTSTAQITNNTISGNGLNVQNGQGYNGLEIYVTCTGNQIVSGNSFNSNSLNGIFIGAGSMTVTGNTFSNNTNGITLYVQNSSSADTIANIFGNQFYNNTLDGVFVQLQAGTSKTLSATIGGTLPNQSNHFSGHGYHAIGCNSQSPAPSLFCPSGGNTFTGNVDNIEFTCPSTCKE